MRRVQIALATGLALITIAIGVTLARAPLSVAGTNGVPAELAAGHTRGPDGSCQPIGTLPQDISTIRISLSANVGPKVSLRVLSGSRVVTQGTRSAGWGEEETLSVPVSRLPHPVPDAVICTMVGPAIENLQLNGKSRASRSSETHGMKDVLLRMEYLHPGSKSWGSFASSIAHHMGIGHAPGGPLVVFLVLVLMLAVIALASRLALRELR
jgi:hypothetical protein